MAADQDTRGRRHGTSDDHPGASDGHTSSRRERRPPRPVNDPPPQAVMGLLNYITATSLDEDYAHVSRRRASTGAAKKKGGPGTVGLVVLALFGALVATAAVQTSRNADESASSRASLIAQVNARKATLDAQRASAVSLRRQVSALQDSNLDATTQGRAVRARISRLGILTGTAAATGPGIRVVVDDAPGATKDEERVLDQDLQKLVNSLWQVGAEAIAINGKRLTTLTAVRQAGDAITVNFVSLKRPYTVSAIGNKNQMGAQLLDTAGGRTWLTLRASYGLRFDVNSEDSMTLPAPRPVSLRYARQPERVK